MNVNLMPYAIFWGVRYTALRWLSFTCTRSGTTSRLTNGKPRMKRAANSGRRGDAEARRGRRVRLI